MQLKVSYTSIQDLNVDSAFTWHKKRNENVFSTCNGNFDFNKGFEPKKLQIHLKKKRKKIWIIALLPKICNNDQIKT